MKLLTQRQNQTVRRCDARCYDAEPGRCDCVCGGKNHAVGIAKALENVRTMFLAQTGLSDAGKGIPQVTRAATRALARQETQ